MPKMTALGRMEDGVEYATDGQTIYQLVPGKDRPKAVRIEPEREARIKARVQAARTGEGTPAKQPSFLSDMGNLAGAGSAKLVSSAGRVATAAGLDEIGPAVTQAADDVAASYQEGLSDAQRAAQERPFFDEAGNFDSDAVTPRKVAGLVAESVPATAVGMGAGALLMRPLMAAGMSPTAAGITGGAVGEGAIGGVMSAGQIAEIIDQTPEDALVTAEPYQRAYHALPATLDDATRRKQAREQVKLAAMKDAGLRTAVVTAILGAPSGAALGKLIGGEGAATLAGRVAKQGGLEIAQEVPQSAFEQRAQNEAIQQFADPTQDLNEGLAEAMVGGALAGGAMGAGFGAISPAPLPQAQPAPVGGNTEKSPTFDVTTETPPSTDGQLGVPGPQPPESMPVSPSVADQRVRDVQAAVDRGERPAPRDSTRTPRAEAAPQADATGYGLQQRVNAARLALQKHEAATSGSPQWVAQHKELTGALLDAQIENARHRRERKAAAGRPTDELDRYIAERERTRGTGIDVEEGAEEITVAPAPGDPRLVEAADELRQAMREPAPASNIDVQEETFPVERVDGAPPPDTLAPPPDGPGSNVAVDDDPEIENIDYPEVALDERMRPMPPEERARLDAETAKVRARIERIKKQRAIRPAEDDLLTAIAKAGGLRRDEAEAQGVDPANFGRRGFRIARIFTSTGKSFEHMAETLAEMGYPVTDDAGNYSGNSMLEAVSRALAGDDIRTPESRIAKAEAKAAEEPEAIDDFDPFADGSEPFLEDEEYDGLETAGQQAILDAMERAREAGVSEDAIESIAERAAIQELSDEETIAQYEAAIKRTAGRPGGAGEVQGQPGGEARTETAGDNEPVLKPYTAEEVAAREAAKAGVQKAKDDEDKKAAADAQRDSFTLTGSDRDADVAASKGQAGLFDVPAKKPETESKVIKQARAKVGEERFAELVKARLDATPDTIAFGQMRAILEDVAQQVLDDDIAVPEDHPLQTDKREDYIDRAIMSRVYTPNEQKLREAISRDASNDEILTISQLKHAGHGGSWDRAYVMVQGSTLTINANPVETVTLKGNEVAKRLRRLYGSPVDAAAHAAATSPKNDLPDPTDAQKEAGNYQKGHATVDGLNISIENPAGSKRRPEWPTLKSHYGYLKRTEGGDGEHIDVFIRPGTEASPKVFVVDQVNTDSTFDEHKVMMGWKSQAGARLGYLENYTKGWKVGTITPMTMDEFKQWLAEGDTTKPAADWAKSKTTSTKSSIAPASTGKSGDSTEATADDLDSMFDDLVAEETGANTTARAPQSPRAPRAPRQERAPRQPRTQTSPASDIPPSTERPLGESIKSAGKNTAAGLNAAINGLTTLFGGGGKLSSGLTFDEDTYAKAKPLFIQAVRHLKDAANDIREAMRAVIRMVLDAGGVDTVNNMKPYVVRFIGDVQAGRIDLNEATDNGNQDPISDGDAGEGTEGVQPPDSVRGDGETSSDDGRGGEPDADGPDSGSVDGSSESDGSGTDGDRHDDGVLEPRNYRIEPGALSEDRGQAQKARDNIRAIELARTIEAEGRAATPDEQRALSLYIGWGGLSGAFPDTSGAYGKGLEGIGQKIRELLSDTEYATAERSIQYAHYTSETVIRAMWDAALKMGFTGGKVFEPGMGIGHFAGLMPETVTGNTTYNGLELDHTTAHIARLLYPKWGVRQDDFTRAPLPENYYDLVIGNPPFGDIPIKSDPKYATHGFFIHDYFFAKSLDAVRPGGLMMLISSAGTMNKLDSKAREYMAARADLVGAIRLPSSAFKRNANTEVTTDIIILRKKGDTDGFVGADWVETVQKTLPDKDGTPTKGNVNPYFVKNPHMILGREGFFDKLHKGRYAVHPIEGANLSDQLAKAITRLPANIMTEWQDTHGHDDIDFATEEKKDGSYYFDANGSLMQQTDGLGRKVERRGKGVEGGKTQEEIARIRGLVPIRDALRAVYAADLTGDKDNAERARKRLNRAYDAFVKQYGPINKADISYRRPNRVQAEIARAEAREETRYSGAAFEEGTFDPSRMIADGKSLADIARARIEARQAAQVAGRDWDEGSFKPDDMPDIVIDKRPNVDPFIDDPESYRLRAIERYNDVTGEATKGLVFTQSVITKEKAPEINSVGDALLYVLNKQGYPDIDEIAKQAKVSPADAIEQLGESLFEIPGEIGTYVTKEDYLSGDVRKKLKAAEAAAERKERYRRNVAALRDALPPDLPPSQISATLGMPWIPPSVIEEFAKDVLGLASIKVKYIKALAEWVVRGDITSAAATSTYGTTRMPAPAIIAAAMNRSQIKIFDRIDDTQVLNKEATEAAIIKTQEVRTAFSDWVFRDGARAERLAGLYNERYNAIRAWQGDGSYLTTPGISSDWSWRPHQLRVIARILRLGNTYMAHAVGAGKTSAMIGAVMEARRLGLWRKPMIAVPNHMLGQFTKEFYEQYPTAKLMIADERRFHTHRRKQFIADVANQDLDAVIITHSAFGKIPVSNTFQDAIIQEQIDEYREIESELGEKVYNEESDKRITRKRVQNAIERLSQRLSGRMAGNRKDQVFTFEEMGVDALVVDEAHLFRKLDFATRNSSTKGISPEGSQASMDLYVKTRFLRTINPGRHLVLASGTPITNTMAELYTLSRYVQEEELAERDLGHFDAWAAAYGETVTELEQDASGGYKPQTRFSRFVNVPELSAMVRQHMDVVTSAELAQYVTRPVIKDGRKLVVAKKSPEFKAYQDDLANRMRAIEERRGPPQRGDDILLSVINDGRHSALDMRLVDVGIGHTDPPSKLDVMIDSVADIWKETTVHPFYKVKAGGGYESKPFDHGPATQMIFSNLGVSGARGFNVHKYIVAELVARGVPRAEIALIADFDTHVARQRLFNDMNEGKVRVLIGSTAKMATGVNAQRRLYAIHNLDPLWYPADDEQRIGRGLRQGNMNREIVVRDYALDGSYDSQMWGLMGKKAGFIEGFMRGDPAMRTMDDLGESSYYEQAKAITTNDPRLIELTQLRQDLERAQRKRDAFETEIYNAKRRIRESESIIRSRADAIERAEAYIGQREDISGDKFTASIGSTHYTDRMEFGKALLDAKKAAVEAGAENVGIGSPRIIGNIGGFAVRLLVNKDWQYARDEAGEVLRDYKNHKVREDVYLASILLWYDKDHYDVITGNGARATTEAIENNLNGFEEDIKRFQRDIEAAERDIADFKPRAERTYDGGDEIGDLTRKVSAIENTLDQESRAALAALQTQPASEDDEATTSTGKYARRDARAAHQWDERIDTPYGTTYLGDDVSLVPAGVAHAGMWPGGAVYSVVDSDSGSKIGEVVVGISDGQIDTVYFIEAVGRRQGVGRRIMRAILANSTGPVVIDSIIPSARPFWRKIGAFDDDGQNAKLTWEAFNDGGRAAARVSQGMPGGARTAGSPGSPRGAGAAPQGQAESVNKAPSRGLSVSEAQDYLERKAGKAVIRKLLASGKFKILPSNSSEIPSDARRAMSAGAVVFGFTSDDGTTYLIADNLTDRHSTGRLENAYGIFLHEVGVHYGMRTMLGDALFEQVVGRVEMAGKARTDSAMTRAARAAYKQVPKRTPADHVDEEALAWLVTDRANHQLPLVKRIIAKIRAFLVKMGFTGAVTPDALVELARGAAVRSVPAAERAMKFARRDAQNAEVDALAKARIRWESGDTRAAAAGLDAVRDNLAASNPRLAEDIAALKQALYDDGMTDDDVDLGELWAETIRAVKAVTGPRQGGGKFARRESRPATVDALARAKVQWEGGDTRAAATILGEAKAALGDNQRLKDEIDVLTHALYNEGMTDDDVDLDKLWADTIRATESTLNDGMFARRDREAELPYRFDGKRWIDTVDDVAVPKSEVQTQLQEMLWHAFNEAKSNETRAPAIAAEVLDVLEYGLRNGINLSEPRLQALRNAAKRKAPVAAPAQAEASTADDETRTFLYKELDYQQEALIYAKNASSDGDEVGGLRAQRRIEQTIADLQQRLRYLDSGTRFARRAVTETPEFRRWFGNSKIVDSNGRPKVMYHGTWDDFTVFDPDANDRGAVFFSPSKKLAEDYGMDGKTMAVYLSVENPFDYRNREHVDRVMARIKGKDWVKNVGEKAARKAIESGKWENVDSLAADLKALGFDGLYTMEAGQRNVAVFDAAQIKSATGNTGAFDGSNPDILFARRETREKGRESITESPAFKRWFGDSKVVDENGEPLVVYHGSANDIEAFQRGRGNLIFFSPDPEFASSYAFADANKQYMLDTGLAEDEIDNFDDARRGANITPAYISAQNIFDSKGMTYREAENPEFTASLREQGYDGIWIYEHGRKNLAVFDPSQIKSATGNDGSFDPSNPDIRYARREPVEDSPELEQSLTARARARFSPWLDAFRYETQDRFHYLRRAQEGAMLEQGVTELPESQDAYLAELRYHGMAGAGIEDFQRDHVDPLLAAIKTAGVDIEQVDEFLHARHAPEANAQLRKINPTADELADRIQEAAESGDFVLAQRLANHEPYDGDNTALSGMSNDEAAAVIAAARAAGKLQALEDIGRRVDTITAARRALLVQSGLERRETIDAWEGAYQHYVPLKREGKGDGLPRRGKGFDTRGKEKRRAGSTRAVEHILANVVAQHEATIVRAEKAKVGRAMLEFARANPQPALYEVGKVEYQPTFDAQGLVTYRADPGFVMADNVFVVRQNGIDYRITFNDENPDALKIVGALKNLSGQDAGAIINVLSKFTRFLSLVNTGANPEFIISNFARDIQTAGYNLSGTEADKLKWRIIGDVGKAWAGIRAFQKGKDSAWAKHFDAFRKAGAQTGWMDHYKDIRDREQALLDKVRDMDGGVTQSIKHGLKAIEKFIEDENTAVENAIRLSAFVHAREAGLSEAKAARLAKELTVNFNRRGNMGQMLNALYLFFNASIQGQVRIVQAITRSRKVQGLVIGTIIGAALLDIWNRAVGGGDDDDLNPYDSEAMRYYKDRNLVFMMPDGDYVKIPLPWGYNVFHVMGQVIGEAMTRPDFEVGQGVGRLVGATIDAFNPIGGSVSPLQFITPTIGDPIAQWYENKDGIGRPLRPADNPFGPPLPESQKYWGSVRAPSKAVTDWLNDVTGGDEVRPGWADISPEAIDLTIDTLTGGAGRFVADTLGAPWKAAKGEDVESYEVPLLRKVYGKPGMGQSSQDYYQARDAVALTAAQIKHYAGDSEKLAEIRKEHAVDVRMLGQMKAAEKQLSGLRKLRKRETDPARRRAIETQMKAVMDRFNRAYFKAITASAG